ncbi:dynein regulatory complex subunit 2-like [Vespa mandarinia]|uniref:dynein regulatory complex subunit 2-like n=1 Tax=Vespa mandarinia TaxID=7446 RepID=UPI00160BE159|nr:dynein regulatory complex subunit 2-like [Vespa mandarinia]
MPLKRKGKVNKFARMSEEERVRYMQHRAELELEAKRRKQQLVAIFSKNKLKREEAFSRLNTAKINEQWRFILRRIKCKEFYEDVTYLWKNFDRMINNKDKIVQLLHVEIKMADIDHRRSQEAHIGIINKIIELYKQKLRALCDDYIYKVHSVQGEETIELNKLKINMERACKEIKVITTNEKIELEKILTKTRSQNAINICNIISLRKDMMLELQNKISIKIESLSEELNEIMLEYNKTTETKRKQYEFLKEQDDANFTEMTQYPKLNTQLQNIVNTIKNEIENLLEKRKFSINKLKYQMKFMRNKSLAIRKNFKTNQILESTQLKNLSVVCNNVIKDLEKITKKGFALLSLMKLCSELEPLSVSIKMYISSDIDIVEESTMYCVSKPFQKLEKFWLRYNHIKVENISMKKECNKLSAENKHLRYMLRNYLISVSRMETTLPITSIVI